MDEDTEWFHRAFWDLAGSRSDGGGIRFEAVDRYAERYGITDFEEFHALIRAMDAAFLEHQRENRPSTRPKRESKKGG